MSGPGTPPETGSFDQAGGTPYDNQGSNMFAPPSAPPSQEPSVLSPQPMAQQSPTVTPPQVQPADLSTQSNSQLAHNQLYLLRGRIIKIGNNRDSGTACFFAGHCF